MARWASLFLVALASNGCGGESTDGGPKSFDFGYFEALPQKEILPAAQAYLDKRFPAGSALQAAQNELIAAGAKCGRGIDQRGVYHQCSYAKPGPWLFSTLEWKITLRPDQDEKAIVKIAVNRGFTGL